ncbi:Segregation and condensation protein B [Chlamydiales bacterium SCGC AB-751-O23]|jgi:segregation and condensation protein B|nr:Segregation and condensation protein B [Chlamydiales bacterium SCGC AB-751-O23]
MDQEINLLETKEELPEAINPSVKPTPYTASSLPPSNEAQKAIKKIMNEEQELAIRHKLKSCIEALLFSSDTPLRFNRLREVLESIRPVKPKLLQQLLAEIQYDYQSQNRGFVLEEIAEGYIIRTSSEFSSQLSILHSSKRIERLSHASTEVLAIIAYKQPLTRAGVDAIRGVDSTGSLHNLLGRDLIEPVGKQSSPGRPTLYATTPYFLQYFGLKDLSDLKHIYSPADTQESEESNLELKVPENKEEMKVNATIEQKTPDFHEEEAKNEIIVEENFEEEEDEESNLELSIDLEQAKTEENVNKKEF